MLVIDWISATRGQIVTGRQKVRERQRDRWRN